jgi:hypothetical protein
LTKQKENCYAVGSRNFWEEKSEESRNILVFILSTSGRELFNI